MGIYNQWEKQAQKKNREWFKFPQGRLPEIWGKVRRRIPSDPLYYDNLGYTPFLFEYDRKPCTFSVALDLGYLGFKNARIDYTLLRSTEGGCSLPAPKINLGVGDFNISELIPVGYHFVYQAINNFYLDAARRNDIQLPIGLNSDNTQVTVNSIELNPKPNRRINDFTIANVLIELQVVVEIHRNVFYQNEFGLETNFIDLVNLAGGSTPDNSNDPYGMYYLTVSGRVFVYGNTGSPTTFLFICNEPEIIKNFLLSKVQNRIRILQGDTGATYNIRRESTSQNSTFFSRSENTFPFTIPSDYGAKQVALEGVGEDFYGLNYYGSYTSLGFNEQIEQIELIRDFNRRPPPPPPPKKEPDDMDCCEELKGLLRLLIKRVGALPATVPHTITKRDGATRSISSIAEYNAYIVRTLDAIAGQFPIEINVEDTDVTQEGNQSVSFKLPNLAETLAEILGVLLVLRTESSATLDISSRALLETVASKNSAIKAYYAALANSEFLGYKIKWRDELVPCSIDPSQEKLDLLLKDTNQKLSVLDCDDRDNLQKMLAPLLLMSARWTAQNVRTFRGDNIVDQIKDILKIAGELPKDFDKVVKQEQGKDENGNPKPAKQDDFDVFIEDVETGFNRLAGVQDITKPYGRPYENRPRIRKLGATNEGGGETP